MSEDTSVVDCGAGLFWSASRLRALETPPAPTVGVSVQHLFTLTVKSFYNRALDSDPHGSAFIFPPGSGSAFDMQIRIRYADPDSEGKKCKIQQKKCIKKLSSG